ncbi:hypothetical protein DPMN_177577 [Dreissena polymorpha]|uniref:Uncharacterized protein n=1 Tax=Dreissena polymorpha TaxID=45954 RepID=A0A9D4EAH1_DREPO|nr:hypothetical protein DPMN_177577 [Dreissena polymorpha]
MSPKTAPHLLYGAQDQRVSPENDKSPDNVKELTNFTLDEFLPAPHNRPDLRKMSVSSSLIAHKRPKRSMD